MSNNIYFENYCKTIYNFLFTYINFIISVKLVGIIIIYYLLRLLKYYNYLILIDDFILYFIHTLTIILLLCRLSYIYTVKKKINLSFYKLQNLTYDLFSTYLVGYSDTYDIEDIDDSYSHNLIVHNPNNLLLRNTDNVNKKIEIHEFKDILLFYISFFISIIFKVNNLDDSNNFLLNTQIYDNYFTSKFINPYYNYNVNTYRFKLYMIEYNIKSLLTKYYNNSSLLSYEYQQCKNLLNEINEQLRFIYLFLDIPNENEQLFWGNQKNIIIKLINILNDFLIFISIILTIIYYINYLSHTALIYIILLSFLYLYINVLIYILFNNYIPINFRKYGLDLHKLIINIHDEINILCILSQEKINIIYK